MLFVFTLIFACCCLMYEPVNGGGDFVSLVRKASAFENKIMGQLYRICANDDGQLHQLRTQISQKQPHQNTSKSATEEAKALLCVTVRNLKLYFGEIHQQNPTEATLVQAFEAIRNVVEADLMRLMEHLHEHVGKAVYAEQWTMLKNASFKQVNDQLKDVLTELKAFIFGWADGNAQVLACTCLQIMRRQDELFKQQNNNPANTAEQHFPLALARFSIGLWAYAALGVDGVASIAEAATDSFDEKHQPQIARVESSKAEGMGENQRFAVVSHSMASLVRQANKFNRNIMSQLHKLCDGDQQEKYQKKFHKSAKTLLCETVRLLDKQFQKIYLNADKETFRLAFKEIKNAVDTDIAILVVYLDNLDIPAAASYVHQREMKETLTSTFTQLNDHMLKVSAKMHAVLTEQAEGDALELASDCLHTMKELIDNDLFEQKEYPLQWALLRFSVSLWVYVALSVHGVTPIAETATNFVSDNFLAGRKEKRKREEQQHQKHNREEEQKEKNQKSDD